MATAAGVAEGAVSVDTVRSSSVAVEFTVTFLDATAGGAPAAFANVLRREVDTVFGSPSFEDFGWIQTLQVSVEEAAGPTPPPPPSPPPRPVRAGTPLALRDVVKPAPPPLLVVPASSDDNLLVMTVALGLVAFLAAGAGVIFYFSYLRGGLYRSSFKSYDDASSSGYLDRTNTASGSGRRGVDSVDADSATPLQRLSRRRLGLSVDPHAPERPYPRGYRHDSPRSGLGGVLVDAPSAMSASDDGRSETSVSTAMDKALASKLSSLARMRQTLGSLLMWKTAGAGELPSPAGLVASRAERGERADTASSIGGDSRTVQRSVRGGQQQAPRKPVTGDDGGVNSDRWKQMLQYHSNPAFDNPFDVAFPEPSDVGSESEVNLGLALESQLARAPLAAPSPGGKNRLTASLLGKASLASSPAGPSSGFNSRAPPPLPPRMDLMDAELPMPPRSQAPVPILSPEQLSRTFADLRNVVSSIFADDADSNSESDEPTPRSRI